MKRHPVFCALTDLAICGALGAVFLLDLLVPGGRVEWVLYFGPLAACMASRRWYLPVMVALAAAVLIVMGLLLSAPGAYPLSHSVINRTIGIGMLMFTAILMVARNRSRMALRQSHEALRELLARTERTREEERIRMARDVHDSLGQNLTAIKMDLRWIERALEKQDTWPDGDALKRRARSAVEMADATTALIQELASDLRPGVLDRLGLNAAVQFEGRRFQERTGITCRTRVPAALTGMAPEIVTAVFRMLQESLTNVARHAGATRVVVLLRVRDGKVTMRVGDNGVGIHPAAIESSKSLGLLGMKERAAALGGEVDLRRREKHGTIVTITIPTR